MEILGGVTKLVEVVHCGCACEIYYSFVVL